jgi:branched-subunit amino acid transport protein
MMALSLLPILLYLCRLSGFTLQSVQPSPFWENFLRFIPISVFTALVVSALYQETDTSGVKIVALAAAGLVIWRTRRFTLSVLVGFMVLWLLEMF